MKSDNSHIFRRTISMALSAALLCSTLSSCGSKDEEVTLNPDDPVTITVWHYYNGVQQTSFDALVKEFNESVGLEKGIIVEAYSKSSVDELSTSVLASVNGDAGADDAPDIFATYAETAYTVDKLGYLADLSQYLTDDEINEYVDEYIDEGVFSEGTLKIFPVAKSTEVMMVNKTDWDKFAEAEGVSTDDLATFEGITEVADKYYNYTDALTPDVPNDGKAFFGRDSVANYMYIGAKQLDNEYFNISDDGSAEVSITKETLRKLWDNYYVPFVKGNFMAQGKYRSDDAKTGSVIALICSTTGAAYFPTEVTTNDDDTYPIDCLVLPVPYFEGANTDVVQQGAGMSVIKSDEESEYASVEFLKWFTEEERNVEFSISSGYMPVKKSANDIDKILSANDKLESPMNTAMLDTMKVAIEQVNDRDLYTSKAFAKSAESRDYIGYTMQDTAAAAYEEAQARIDAGEDRSAVLDEYISDDAFEVWYNDFISGLEKVIE